MATKNNAYLTASKGSSISYDQFAFGIGAKDGITRDESVVWHKEYLKADKADRADYAFDWRLNYLMGNLKISEKEADRILSQTRDQRKAEHQKAYKRANSQFVYHIVRPVEKSGVSKQVKVTVDKVVELFEQLSKAEQAKFMRIVK
jgi:hypothetical protein